MSDPALQISQTEALGDDPTEVERDFLIHLLLTAWMLVLEQEPAPALTLGPPDRKHPIDPLA
jgi:hypothetical protein